MRKYHRYLYQGLLGTLLVTSLVGEASQVTASQLDPTYCHISPSEVTLKNSLRVAAQRGNRQDQIKYHDIVKKHVADVKQCRQKSWLKNQAIWIRLYPCDSRPGGLEEIFDRMVNKGYNQVYVATFYSGQVLLPRSKNPTAWGSVLTSRGTEKTDLLAESINKGRERGLKVYAWMYSLSFGVDYGMTPEGESTLAMNGRGESTLFAGEEGFQRKEDGADNSVLFVDPYSDKAREDYGRLVREVARHRPDGVLFDYIRFPRGQGAQSVASQVKDLWIYSSESRQTLAALAENSKATDLIERFLTNGTITLNDLKEVDKLYPKEVSPLWEGRTPPALESTMSYEQKLTLIESDLWQLALNHARRGVTNFLQKAAEPLDRQGIKSGAVFFPEGNRLVGKRGYDSRMQPWDKFTTPEWHPMSYATCNRSDCIVAQVKTVLDAAPAGTAVMPVLAGTWHQPMEGRPSLEEQMEGIHNSLPQINSISHFAYSWQEPSSDYYRSTCQLRSVNLNKNN